MDSERELDSGLVRLLIRKLDEAVLGMEKANIAEYVELYRRPRRLIVLNLVGGVTRGVGIAIGWTVVAAVFLSMLFYIAKLNLPLVGNYVADIADIVKHRVY